MTKPKYHVPVRIPTTDPKNASNKTKQKLNQLTTQSSQCLLERYTLHTDITLAHRRCGLDVDAWTSRGKERSTSPSTRTDTTTATHIPTTNVAFAAVSVAAPAM